MAHVTDFLRDKWRQSFRFFDVNNDGKITREDFALIADNVSRLTNASPEVAKKSREEWEKWFRYLQPDPSIVVNEDQFVASIEELNSKDPEKHERETRSTAADMFNRIDLNKNGTISIQEFETFYKSCGITSESATLDTFKKVDTDADGLIQREEFIDDHVRFFTHPDPVAGKAYLFLAPSKGHK